MKLKDVKVILGSNIYKDITIGSIIDSDGDSSKVKIQTFEKSKPILPPFLTFDEDNRKFIVTPSLNEKPGKYQIVIQLTD
jgi:hypothetical protein